MHPLSEVKFIVIHCADTKSDMNVTINDLRKWHVEDRGWSDIGYHHFVKFDGSMYPCRSTIWAGAHCKAVNTKSIAICLEGGFDGEDNFTEVQLNSLYMLIQNVKREHPNAAIVGHSHFDDKACPSFDVVKWYEGRVKNAGR